MNGEISPRELTWFRKPELYILEDDRLVLETQPYTSFHSHSYDSTDACGMILPQMECFSFSTKIDYQFTHLDEECGLFLKRNNTHWAKAGVECRKEFLDLSCTVYEDGYGDRSCRQLGAGIRWLYLRILYWNGNVRFQYSFHGEVYSDMRWLHFADSSVSVQAGIYACSPGDSSFDCTFSKMKLQKI